MVKKGIALSPHSWEREYMEAGVVLLSFPSFSFRTPADGMVFFFSIYCEPFHFSNSVLKLLNMPRHLFFSDSRLC